MHKQMKRRRQVATFVMRDTKKCESVTRYGQTTDKYAWCVVSRDGTAYYYGRYADGGTADSRCVLSDARGNVAYWALAEVVDVHGNSIRYEYEKSEGNELYLTTVYYTGTTSSPNGKYPYRIRICYGDRNDIITDGRLGFVRKTDRKVCYIDVSYWNTSQYTSVIRYQFDYEYDPLRLEWVSLYDVPTGVQSLPNGMHIDDCMALPEFFMGHRLSITAFNYYQPDLSDMFSAEDVLITDRNNGDDWNMLNQSSNIGWNVGGTLTLGLGKQVWQTNLSAGGNYSYSEGQGTTNYMLMDIDGDGLADKVYSKGNEIYFRKQVAGADGKPYFATERGTGMRSSNLSLETSKTNSWGLQAGADPAASVSGGWSNTDTYTSCYFSDVNGDGLPDLVDDGVVHFNRLNAPAGDFAQHTGENQVTIDSSQCKSYFYYDGTVALSDECYIDSILRDSFSVSTGDYYYPCEDCEQHCYNYLYGLGNDPDVDGLFCRQCMQHRAPDCESDLQCREPEWSSDNEQLQELCDRYHDVCPECLHQLAVYGFDSDEYRSCADYYVFRGQRTM